MDIKTINTIDKTARGCPSNDRGGSCAKLNVYDWLGDVQNIINPEEIVEVRFKNTRKDYYRNVNGLALRQGDMVAVEASPGHDIGMVSLIGDLVLKQMKRRKATLVDGDFRKIYRIAKSVDLQKWEESIQLEHQTMLRARKIAEDLKLNMKIGDVEFQGDKTKAIFYYIADERVDFRELIKLYAEAFHIRIEMRQIGARQEAGRIGGIGPCGRELCCCTWISNFISVTTNAARYQEISLNPQKLAGQCSKLKCCLNYELDSYIDAQKYFPPTNIPLETEKGNYNYMKADIFKGIFYYVGAESPQGGVVAVSVDNVKEIMRLNRSGKKIAQLTNESVVSAVPEGHAYHNTVGQESLDRFDKSSKSRRKKRHKPQLTRKPRPEYENNGDQKESED